MKTLIIIAVVYIGLFAGLSYFAKAMQSVAQQKADQQTAYEAPGCTTDADCAERTP